MKRNKSGEPVSERYAGVSVANEQLMLVPFLIACRLKKAGYDIKTDYRYDNEGNLSCKSTPCNWNGSEDVVSAPRLEEVKQWLKTKGVLINVYCRSERVNREDGVHYDYIATSDWMRSIYALVEDKYLQIKRPVTPFATEEDALAISIREGVMYLLKEGTPLFKK